jgi:hypothetical protein
VRILLDCGFRNGKAEDGGQMTEARGRRSEATDLKLRSLEDKKVRRRTTEVRGRKTEDGGLRIKAFPKFRLKFLTGSTGLSG